MKKRIGIIVTAFIISLVVGLLIWRFWPRSSSHIISIDESAFTGVSAVAMVSRLEDGAPYSDIYRIDPPNDAAGDVLEVLSTSRYRPDFRNLLPWNLDSLSSGKNYDGRIVSLTFSAVNQEEQFVSFDFLSSTIVQVHIGNESGFRIYHPTNRNTIDKLVEYLQANGVTPEGNKPSEPGFSVHYSMDYAYCIEGDVYVAKETLQVLDTFGKPEYILPAEPETQVYTQIPDVENNAKGREPISFVLPEFDLTNYSDTRYLKDYESGMEVATYYRMLGNRLTGIPSDEMIKVYIDSSGNITHYETVNLGKYDRLNQEEAKFDRLQDTFSQAVYEALHIPPTNLRAFTDTQGRLVIAATVGLAQEHQNIEATLYAVVKETKLFL